MGNAGPKVKQAVVDVADKLHLIAINLKIARSMVSDWEANPPSHVEIQCLLGLLDAICEILEELEAYIVSPDAQEEILETINLMTKINRKEVKATKGVRSRLRAGIACARRILKNQKHNT